MEADATAFKLRAWGADQTSGAGEIAAIQLVIRAAVFVGGLCPEVHVMIDCYSVYEAFGEALADGETGGASGILITASDGGGGFWKISENSIAERSFLIGYLLMGSGQTGAHQTLAWVISGYGGRQMTW